MAAAAKAKAKAHARGGRRPASAAETHGDALRALGHAVRARRHALGLTLNDVAQLTGLSPPFLSQIETSFATPSLTSLFAIARVLKTTPETLLAGPTSDEIMVVRRDQGRVYPVTDAPRTAHRRQLTSLDEPFSGAEYVVDPGADMGGFFASSGREMIHVIEGELIVDIVGEDGDAVPYELGEGDTLVYNTSAQHRWRHDSERTTRFLHYVNALVT